MTVIGDPDDDESALPEGWAWATPDELAETTRNALAIGPFGSNLKVVDYTGEGVPLIFVRDIRAESFGGPGTRFVKIEKARELASHSVRPGDVLVTKMGEPPGDTSVYPPGRPVGIITADCIKLTPNTAVASAEYLKHSIRAQQVRSQIINQTRGAAQQKLSLERFRQIQVPLAPLAEQHRIVERVEALVACVEAARDRLTRASAILKRFRQSVLAAACSGALTAEWREGHDSSADEVSRTQLLTLRSQLTGQRIKFRAQGAVDGTPRSWTALTTDELTTVVTSGSRAWSRFYDRGDSTFVMAQNVRPLRLDLTHRQAVDPPRDDPERDRTLIEKDDILVTIVGANTGDVCRVDRPLREHFVCQSVALMRPTDRRMAGFMELWLNSMEHGRRQYLDYMYGEGRPHLSLDQLRQTLIAVPGWTEQQEIAQRVDVLLSLADTIETRINVALARSEELPQAILAKAFAGELVPNEAELAQEEGRNYEHASTLLERLRDDLDQAASTRTTSSGRRRRA